MAQLIGGLLLLWIIILVVVYIIIPGLTIGLALSVFIGALLGGGSAVKNYCVAFNHNVRRERTNGNT